MSYLFDKKIVVNDLVYELILTEEHEVILAAPYSMDEFGHDTSRTMYRAQKGNTGMLVYRKAARIFLDYLHTHKISYFYFTVDDKIRNNLYFRFACELEKYGYKCYYADDNKYMFRRVD